MKGKLSVCLEHNKVKGSKSGVWIPVAVAFFDDLSIIEEVIFVFEPCDSPEHKKEEKR